MKTVWRIAAAGKNEKLYGKHPTQKPIALIDRCLRASTNPGDLVLDPFAGSGATGVAALVLDRRFIGCERETEFAELMSKRLASVAGCTSETAYPASDAANQRKLFDKASKVPAGLS